MDGAVTAAADIGRRMGQRARSARPAALRFFGEPIRDGRALRNRRGGAGRRRAFVQPALGEFDYQFSRNEAASAAAEDGRDDDGGSVGGDAGVDGSSGVGGDRSPKRSAKRRRGWPALEKATTELKEKEEEPSEDGAAAAPAEVEKQRQAGKRMPPPRKTSNKKARDPPILVSKIDVVCSDKDLEDEARAAVYLKPNLSYNKSDVEDIIRRFASMGVFSGVKVRQRLAYYTSISMTACSAA